MDVVTFEEANTLKKSAEMKNDEKILLAIADSR